MDTIPARFKWVKEDFDRIAFHGMLGDPGGAPGMAYLRVSSAGQAEEGRSGFPRQLLHVHEKAQQVHVAIPWELVFFDDHTGFEFRERPALTKLRSLSKSTNKPSNDLVIENLDRLSREATWHQGFLLDEFEKDCKIHVHFWKELGSKLERAVYGTVAQDRMLTDLERMATGNLIKAKSGRVTARTAAFGYKLVNSNGGVENAKKDTHYGIDEQQADIVRDIYCWVVEQRLTLTEVSKRLTKMGVQPPKKSQNWDPSLLHAIVTNSVYKGEFYAHRYVQVKRISQLTGREVIHKIERPREEGISVAVPPLVSAEIWAAAGQELTNNRSRSMRNSKADYLLVGFLHCADCGARMSSGAKHHDKLTRRGPKTYHFTYYRCTTQQRPKHIVEQLGIHCSMPQASRQRIDDMIWHSVVNVLFDRKRLEDGIERYLARQNPDTAREEIAYVRSRITDADLEDSKLYEAYVSGAFDAEEYSQKRWELKQKKKGLETQMEELQAMLSQLAGQAQRKKSILSTVHDLKQRAQSDLPFALKRKIVMMVVDKITLNTREEWFEIEGALYGRFDFNSTGRGSWPPPA